jgi:hypothetical protein
VTFPASYRHLPIFGGFFWPETHEIDPGKLAAFKGDYATTVFSHASRHARPLGRVNPPQRSPTLSAGLSATRLKAPAAATAFSHERRHLPRAFPTAPSQCFQSNPPGVLPFLSQKAPPPVHSAALFKRLDVRYQSPSITPPSRAIIPS